MNYRTCKEADQKKPIESPKELEEFLNKKVRATNTGWRFEEDGKTLFYNLNNYDASHGDDKIQIVFLSPEELQVTIKGKTEVVPPYSKTLQETFGRMLGYVQTKFENLQMQGWDYEREIWCRIVDIRIPEDNIGLNIGPITFWKKLSETPIRYIPKSQEDIAQDIEMDAAMRAYNCGLGVGEWEAFLNPQEKAALNTLAKEGYGTWGKERNQKECTRSS